MARVLVVEDNPDLLVILRTLLEDEHEVLPAATGELAIELARARRPDIVILDLQLPAMDGIETGRLLKRMAAPRPLPILALTALAGAVDRERALHSGCCDAFLAKPATLESIRERVRELLGDEPEPRAA